MINQYFPNKKIEGTGSVCIDDQIKTVIIPFDKYEIVVKLNDTNEFVGIEEIKINKNFINFSQKTNNVGYLDVAEYYTDK